MQIDPCVLVITLYSLLATYVVSQTSLSNELCNGCRLRNGKYFNADPDSCYNYIHCHFNDGGFGAANRRPCTPGHFWNNTLSNCVPASWVNCPNDECRNNGVTGYPVAGNCRAYWACRNQRTVGIECCPSGYRYYSGFGCLSDRSCSDKCPPEERIDRNCYYVPDPNNPRKYRYTPVTLLTLCCPRGLGFDASTCGCTKSVPTTQPTWCQPSVRINFDRRVYDNSLEEISISNHLGRVRVLRESTATDGWVGNFPGTNSRLTMPRFSNTPFGPAFKIFIRFKELPGEYIGREILLSNADCGAQPVLMLSFDRRTKELTFMARFNGNAKYLTVKYVEGAWKDVFIMYESHVLYLSIDNRDNDLNVLHQEQVSLVTTHTLDVSKCALNLGWGELGVAYRGIIDAFRVYLCAT